MKVLTLPRNPNPYQELLNGELRKRGIQVKYLGARTPFWTLSLVLLPFELAARRAAGFRIVHLHWVWAFNFYSMPYTPARRWLAYAWFRLFLGTIRALGMKLAWTAHNVLPHDQVFPDDSAARKLLVKHCDVVFGHSAWTLTGLMELDAQPHRWVPIRHPAFDVQDPPEVSVYSGDRDQTELLFFGKILEYKGIEELLAAFADLPIASRAHLTIAGECNDPKLLAKIWELARRSGDRVTLRIGRVPDAEVGSLMNSAHVVVLPFRRVTTSGSAMLALSYGKPLIVPSLAPLAELPTDAVFRYGGSVQDLTATLLAASTADYETLNRMSKAALAYAGEATWAQTAETTAAEFRRLLR